MFRLGYSAYFRFKGNRETKIGTGKIVSRKYKFILFMIPKVATSSFIFSFPEHSRMDFDAFPTQDSLVKLFLDEQESKHYYKFAFVRNPWARVVSCYNDKICDVNKINKITIIAKYPGLRPDMPFGEFVRWLCSEEGRDEYADRHWKSQYRLLTDDCGKVPFDYVGKLENLEEDMKRICDQISIPEFAIPHRNPGSKHIESRAKTEKFQNYRKYYTKETRNLIAERYKKDIEAFSYVF